MTKSQGIELAKSQLADGWSLEDIKTYFELLEGVQFANWIYNQLYYVYCAEPAQGAQAKLDAERHE